jgi:hypothetical protein
MTAAAAKTLKTREIKASQYFLFLKIRETCQCQQQQQKNIIPKRTG